MSSQTSSWESSLSWAEEIDAEIGAPEQRPEHQQATCSLLREPISSWTDETETEMRCVPPPTEEVKGNLRIVTSYRHNQKGQLEKVVRIFKIEKVKHRVVSENVLLRRTWKKFGDCVNDGMGVNPENTYRGEPVQMRPISSTQDDDTAKMDDDPLTKLKEQNASVVKCRICNGEHWTVGCPSKDLSSTTAIKSKAEPSNDEDSAVVAADVDKSAAYVPPFLQGRMKRGNTFSSQTRDCPTVIIHNLSSFTTERDLEELVRPFGPVSKISLARDKITGECRGVAFINFKDKCDGAAAIAKLNGFGYDHLILKVNWKIP